jgi:hypothetical protein
MARDGDTHLSLSFTTSRFRKPGKRDGEGGGLAEKNRATRGSDSSLLAEGDAISNRLPSGRGKMGWAAVASKSTNKTASKTDSVAVLVRYQVQTCEPMRPPPEGLSARLKGWLAGGWVVGRLAGRLVGRLVD